MLTWQEFIRWFEIGVAAGFGYLFICFVWSLIRK